MLQKDDLKAIIDGVNSLIDARAKTTEILIRGEITSVKEEFNKRLDETTEELHTEILAGRAEAKQITSIYAPNREGHKKPRETT